MLVKLKQKLWLILTVVLLDQKPSGECDVDIDYDGKCSPSSRNCNIDIDVVTNPPPSGKKELKLKYLLETGISCNKVKSSFKAQCLLASNTQNTYESNVDITTTTGAGTTSDNQFNFQGSQQVRDTKRQDNFKANNGMTQDVRVNTQGANSVVDTDGPGDNFVLKYLQDIVHPDDTTNTNIAKQTVDLNATSGGKIITSDHRELGYSLKQRLIDIDDRDTNQASSPVTATNRANQVLGIDSDNGAEIQYDTHRLSLVSQTIDDCSFGQANCLNSAGNPALSPTTILTNGQVVQLTAHGAGTTIDVDNLRQLLNQNIDNFKNANDRDATNRADLQLFHAVAANGGDIDMALRGVTEQTQSISQSIRNSDEETENAANLQRIKVGIDFIPIEGLVKADLDQRLQQSISGANIGPSINSGTMTITLLAKEGPSELFVEGFDQYLTQTAACSNCQNNGQIHALFEVDDTATFTLQPGSIQGLTQTANVDDAFKSKSKCTNFSNNCT